MPPVTASVQVCFVRLGTFQHAIDFRALMEWRSNLFSVVSTEQSLDHLPDPRIEGGFSDAELEEQLRPTNNGNGLTIGITDAALSGGFYLRRLSDNEQSFRFTTSRRKLRSVTALLKASFFGMPTSLSSRITTSMA